MSKGTFLGWMMDLGDRVWDHRKGIKEDIELIRGIQAGVEKCAEMDMDFLKKQLARKFLLEES